MYLYERLLLKVSHSVRMEPPAALHESPQLFQLFTQIRQKEIEREGDEGERLVEFRDEHNIMTG